MYNIEFIISIKEFYIVHDLMGWSYEELIEWVEVDVERINELYKEVYGEDANYAA